MTITFQCPKCKGLCAFDQKHAGRQARCTACQTRFIIPATSNEKPKTLKIEYASDGGAISGFYSAVFVKSWRVFAHKNNTAGIVLVLAAVVLKFIMANRNFVLSVYIQATGKYLPLYLPFGTVTEILCWGVIFWYYMSIINTTAFEVDELPELNVQSFWEIFVNSIKTVFHYIVTLVVVFLPSVILIIVQESTSAPLKPAVYFFAIISAVIFPMAILNVAVSQDINSVFRVDRLVMPILKIPKPYLTVVALVITAALIEVFTHNFNREMLDKPSLAALHFVAKIAIQIPTIIAMRSIGLLYRHYGGYLL